MVGEAVEGARVGEVLEDAVVVDVARDQVARWATAVDGGAAARLAEECLLAHEADLALEDLLVRLLQLAEPLEQKRRRYSPDGGDRVCAVELAGERLAAKTASRQRAAKKILGAHRVAAAAGGGGGPLNLRASLRDCALSIGVREDANELLSAGWFVSCFPWSRDRIKGQTTQVHMQATSRPAGRLGIRLAALSGERVRLSVSVGEISENQQAPAEAPDDIRVIQEERPLFTGGCIWEAAQLMEGALRGLGINLAGARVLELGSGTGWLALKLARRGAIVTATDRRGMMDLLERNLLRNQCRWKNLDVECVELDWEDAGAWLPGPWDVIIGTDIFYLRQFYAPIVDVLVRHASRATRVLCAWQERKQEGRLVHGEFLQLAIDAGFGVQLRRSLATAAGAPVYLYELTCQVAAEA